MGGEQNERLTMFTDQENMGAAPADHFQGIIDRLDVALSDCDQWPTGVAEIIDAQRDFLLARRDYFEAAKQIASATRR